MLIACSRVSCEHLKANVLPDHSFKKAANLGSARVELPHLRMVLARALASGIRNKGVRPSSQNHLGCGLGAAMVQGGVAINVCSVDWGAACQQLLYGSELVVFHRHHENGCLRRLVVRVQRCTRCDAVSYHGHVTSACSTPEYVLGPPWEIHHFSRPFRTTPRRSLVRLWDAKRPLHFVAVEHGIANLVPLELRSWSWWSEFRVRNNARAGPPADASVTLDNEIRRYSSDSKGGRAPQRKEHAQLGAHSNQGNFPAPVTRIYIVMGVVRVVNASHLDICRAVRGPLQLRK